MARRPICEPRIPTVNRRDERLHSLILPLLLLPRLVAFVDKAYFTHSQ